jgi:hypothetical protein
VLGQCSARGIHRPLERAPGGRLPSQRATDSANINDPARLNSALESISKSLPQCEPSMQGDAARATRAESSAGLAMTALDTPLLTSTCKQKLAGLSQGLCVPKLEALSALAGAECALPKSAVPVAEAARGAPMTCAPFMDTIGRSLHELIRNPSRPPQKWPEAYRSLLDVAPPAAWPERPLSELTGQSALGGFRSAGWVVARYVPPRCPPKARCKPTPPRHVVMGVSPPSEAQSPTLTLLTPEPLALKLRVRYEISFVLCDAGYGDGVLVSFRETRP